MRLTEICMQHRLEKTKKEKKKNPYNRLNWIGSWIEDALEIKMSKDRSDRCVFF